MTEITQETKDRLNVLFDELLGDDEEVDDYGNTEADFKNCCFPDCGCDGARNCMAPSGANYGSNTLNIEKGSLK